MMKINYKNIQTRVKALLKNRTVYNTLRVIVIIATTFVCYYFLFAINFDTPIDAELKTSIKQLREEYDKLNTYNKEIEDVLINLEQRDSDIYFTIFNTYPEMTNISTIYVPDINLYGEPDVSLVNMASSDQYRLSKKIIQTKEEHSKLENKLLDLSSSDISKYPSIQPVTNKDLSIKITPAGRRIDPFYKGAITHYGIDYLVPDGTRVFATASGIVERIKGAGDKQGTAIIVNHGNGYTTIYAHLSKAIVSNGKSVVAGEIIGYSGNSGASFVPHLHYEVKYNNRYLDPTDFFFRELDPRMIKNIKKLAEQNILALD